MKLGSALGLALFCLLLPADAFAWGIITHVQIGRTFLEQFRDFLSVCAPCILNFPSVFLYGSIAPDRFLAKNLQRYREHTHNWDRAFSMLSHAGTDDLKAFSLGYLCHLAADVVAHNLYVPLKIIEMPGATGRRHSYWEVKFEDHQPEDTWTLADKVDRDVDKELYDSFMELFQIPSLFSFSTNMRLTDQVFKMMGSPAARRVVARFESRSASPLGQEEVNAYMDLSKDCVRSLLEDREHSYVTATDPRGGSRINTARMLSKAVASIRKTTNARKLEGVDRGEVSSLLEDAAAVLPGGERSGTLASRYLAINANEGKGAPGSPVEAPATPSRISRLLGRGGRRGS